MFVLCCFPIAKLYLPDKTNKITQQISIIFLKWIKFAEENTARANALASQQKNPPHYD
jgi:hypothetical protein